MTQPLATLRLELDAPPDGSVDARDIRASLSALDGQSRPPSEGGRDGPEEDPVSGEEGPAEHQDGPREDAEPAPRDDGNGRPADEEPRRQHGEEGQG